MRDIENSADFAGGDGFLERLISRLPSIKELHEQKWKDVEEEQDLLRKLEDNLDAERDAEHAPERVPIPFDPEELEKQLLERIIAVGEQQGKIHNKIQGLKIIQDQHTDEVVSTTTISGVVFAVNTQPWKDQLEFWERLEPELAQRMIVLCHKYLEQRARNRGQDYIQEYPAR
jgi:hypothetical protein